MTASFKRGLEHHFAAPNGVAGRVAISHCRLTLAGCGKNSKWRSKKAAN
jgi:hypothetical protein